MAGSRPPMGSYRKFCVECGYLGKPGKKGCPVCGRKKRKPRKTNEEIIREESHVEREEFLDKVARGLDTFNMESCGDEAIDALVADRRKQSFEGE